MKKGVNINFSLSNRAIYTLITLTLVLILGVGVYASTFANPATGVGHDLSEIGLPNCVAGQVLGFASGNWVCSNFPASDTNCGMSGVCSQVCIGNDCKMAWPATASVFYNPSNNFIISSNSQKKTKSTSFIKLKEIKVPVPGIYRIKFQVNAATFVCIPRGKIYINGVPTGSIKTGGTITQDLAVDSGDSTVEVWGHITPGGSGGNCGGYAEVTVSNFRIYGTPGLAPVSGFTVNLN